MSASHPGAPPSPIPNNPFTISIHTATRTFQLKVLQTTTVRELKALIAAAAPSSVEKKFEDVTDSAVDGRMHLMLNPGDDLENYLSSDDFRLGRGGVREGCTIAVVTRPMVIVKEGEEQRLEYRIV